MEVMRGAHALNGLCLRLSISRNGRAWVQGVAKQAEGVGLQLYYVSGAYYSSTQLGTNEVL